MRLGRPRAALIVAPHPDDEVIGAGLLIAALRRRGCAVRVVVVSDGGASHTGSARWPRARLVAERRRESRRALKRLAVSKGAVIFLGLPDGALDRASCRRALGAMVRQRRLDLIVGPAPDDDHPDHRTVARALAGAPGKTRRLAYRVWPARRRPLPLASRVASPGGGGLESGRVMRLAGAGLAKRSLIRCYRTQLGAIADDPQGFAIARHELDAFAHPIERFVELRR